MNYILYVLIFKEQEKPLRTMLEVMTKYFVERGQPSLYESRSSVKQGPVPSIDDDQKNSDTMAELIQPDSLRKTPASIRNNSIQKEISAVISPPLIDSTRLSGFSSAADKDVFETKSRPSSSVLNSRMGWYF